MDALSARAAAEAHLEIGHLGLAVERPLELRYAGSSNVMRVEVPSESAKAVSLAYVILMSDVPTDDEPDFAGASLWMRDWDLWGEASGRVGLVLLESLRARCGVRESVKESPVMVFSPGELPLAHTAMTLALLFQWDAFYVPQSRQFVAFSSHDGYVDLMTNRPIVHDRLYQRFSRGGWAPSLR